MSVFERYAFVAITAQDLAVARRFWVDQLGCAVTEDGADAYFIVDAGGLRLCIDRADGQVHRLGGSDPAIGLKVSSVDESLARLRERGCPTEADVVTARRGRYATLRDPDGHAVILTEMD